MHSFNSFLFLFLFVIEVKSQNSWFFNSFQQKIRGNLLSNDQSNIPFGSQIIVSLVDVALQDTSSRPLTTFALYGSYRFPISFELNVNPTQISTYQQLAIQARIEKDGQLLFINDQYTPVRFPTSFVNVWMKNVGQTTTNSFVCQLRPDPGNCYASFEQFYYNSQWRTCLSFIWGGCGGNGNRFSTRDECERTCSSNRRQNFLFFSNSKRRTMKK